MAIRFLPSFLVMAAGLGGIETPTTVIDHPTATTVVKLEFGLRSSEARRWSGQSAVSDGTIQASWGWHFNRPDRIAGSAGWEFETREFNPAGAPYRFRESLPRGVEILPNGVYVSVEAPPTATFSVRTNRGDFSFRLADLAERGRLEFLGGDVAAVSAPAVRPLTRGEASQHDYPAAIATEDGLFVAWTTFHNEANVLYLGWHDGEGWRTLRVTSKWSDYFGTALASDSDGRIHVIWSEYEADRWRLVDRVLDPDSGSWLNEVYIAPDGRRQYFPVAVTTSDGGICVAWQEFRGDNLDVMAAWYDAAWSEPIRVSESSANDWAPDIAAGPDGSAWVAWDGYERGRYDVYLRRLVPGRADPPVEVPNDPNRAIEPSVAVDGRGRVWIAWAQSGPNWGKDWGVLGRPGTQVRATSTVRLVRYADGQWMEPTTSLEDSVPAWMAATHEYPTVEIGDGGVPYIFFRQMYLRLPVREPRPHGIAEWWIGLACGASGRRSVLDLTTDLIIPVPLSGARFASRATVSDSAVRLRPKAALPPFPAAGSVRGRRTDVFSCPAERFFYGGLRGHPGRPRPRRNAPRFPLSGDRRVRRRRQRDRPVAADPPDEPRQGHAGAGDHGGRPVADRAGPEHHRGVARQAGLHPPQDRGRDQGSAGGRA